MFSSIGKTKMLGGLLTANQANVAVGLGIQHNVGNSADGYGNQFGGSSALQTNDHKEARSKPSNAAISVEKDRVSNSSFLGFERSGTPPGPKTGEENGGKSRRRRRGKKGKGKDEEKGEGNVEEKGEGKDGKCRK